MTPRIQTGTGIRGAVQYVLGEGKDPETRFFKTLGVDDESRVNWIHGRNFGISVNDRDDAMLAVEIMQHDITHQNHIRKCKQVVVHLSLSWAPGQKPTKEEMLQAEQEALDALGMGNAKRIVVSHNDEDYEHIHSVILNINPATGRRYDLLRSQRKLSLWAEDYEKRNGGIVCTNRVEANELRRAIAARDEEAVLEAITKQNSTFTPHLLTKALKKEIDDDPEERERFKRRILESPNVVELIDPQARKEGSGESWVTQTGGLEKLTPDQKTEAEQAYQIWATEKNPQAAKRHDLSDYVNYCQTRHAEEHGREETPFGDRYTTKAVLLAEEQVITAANQLKAGQKHAVSDRLKRAILKSHWKPTTDPTEQKSALEQKHAFHHVTGASGFAVIDGQAGTGKSHTLIAIREAYEADGHTVLGLSLKNETVVGMRRDGFNAETIHTALMQLNNKPRWPSKKNKPMQWDPKTVLVIDEASQVDTRLMSMVFAHAVAAHAKIILVGDDRQLSSIDRGGMLSYLKATHGSAELSTVRRQHKNDERRASEHFASGNFHEGLEIYEQKGAIRWVRTQPEARELLVKQWAADSLKDPTKSRSVLTYTNEDVANLNRELRAIRKQRGELGEDHKFDTPQGHLPFAVGDSIQFTDNLKRKKTPEGKWEKLKVPLIKGARAIIREIKDGMITVGFPNEETTTFNGIEFPKFRHGYAGTIYSSQSSTIDQIYLYHTAHWRKAASYVGLTRHRDKAEIFVATNTAKDLKQLARQMARVDEKRAASMFEQKHSRLGYPDLMTPEELLPAIAPKAQPSQEQIITPEQMLRDIAPQMMPGKDTRLAEAMQEVQQTSRTLETTKEQTQEQTRKRGRSL